jgi:hypothetical protein
MYFTVRYILKRRIAQILTRTPLRRSLQLINTRRLQSDIDCVEKTGWDSFWPIRETMEQLSEWMDVSQVEATFGNVVNQRDRKSVRKLQSIQTISYRLLGT